MAYVVSATWTAQPGKEDVVLDAIEKLTPPSREEPGNLFYQAYQDPAEPSVFRLFEIYDDEEAYAAHGASDHFKRVRARAGHPRARRTASARSTRRSADPMRLAAFRRHTDEPHPRVVGLVRRATGGTWWVHPFHAGTDLVELLAATPSGERRGRRGRRRPTACRPDEVVLLPPVYPVAMRDFLTFEAHVDGMERGHGNPGPPAEWYDAPVFLFMAPHAVTGPYDDVAFPPDTERLDFELEIAAVVCRDVRNATPEEARAAIGGYCVMNDWSARDVQGREMKLKLGPSKGKDFATTIGPWVVTADELDTYRDADGFLDLEMTVSVNGVQVGGDRSGHMGWSFEQLVSHASRASWVKAGEVLASGTCASGSLAETWGRTGRADPAAAAGRRRRRDDHRGHRHHHQPGRRLHRGSSRRSPARAAASRQEV